MLVANEVLVKKTNEKWRMCVYFRHLNKACLKDSYPLPRINQLVAATSSHNLFTFMDAYLGYNQIQMAEGDAQHIAFYVDSNIYHYTVIHLGLIYHYIVISTNIQHAPSINGWSRSCS